MQWKHLTAQTRTRHLFTILVGVSRHSEVLEWRIIRKWSQRSSSLQTTRTDAHARPTPSCRTMWRSLIYRLGSSVRILLQAKGSGILVMSAAMNFVTNRISKETWAVVNLVTFTISLIGKLETLQRNSWESSNPVEGNRHFFPHAICCIFLVWHTHTHTQLHACAFSLALLRIFFPTPTHVHTTFYVSVHLSLSLFHSLSLSLHLLS